MSNETEVQAVFDKLSDGLDKVYDLAQGSLDEAFTVVDKFFGEWQKRAVAMAQDKDKGTEEEITLKTKIEDIIHNRKREGRQSAVWNQYRETDTVPDKQKDIDYTNRVWNNIPDRFKSVRNGS